MEDEEIKMIPTRGRTKIPRALSFAASPKTFSLAFRDVPQFELLTLSFSCNVPVALRSTTRLYQFVWIHLRPVYWFEPDEVEDFKWDIQVGVCRCEDAHQVREWLSESGFNSAREWLLRQETIEGEFKRASWRAFFDEDTREFSIEQRD